MEQVRLTQYSHGAGCGCKISPQVLDKIVKTQLTPIADPMLLVGNESKDDAAVYDLGNKTAVISTTDFFMPIVDDPYDFGRIAATNAISDIYAMGGKPIMAIAILGWPVDLLAPEVAQKVIEGGRSVCAEIGISLAGGHSIDTPEPIFGLAVTGIVNTEQIKRNNSAENNCKLFITKPLGIGILTTAEKQSKLEDAHQGLARDWMCRLNTPGVEFATVSGVKAMTDITGFGLMGHLCEICEGSGLKADIWFDKIPLLPGVLDYIQLGCIPGGTRRNYDSYGQKIAPLTEIQKAIVCDPQTSGGLLLAVSAQSQKTVENIARKHNIELQAIGELSEEDGGVLIEVH